MSEDQRSPMPMSHQLFGWTHLARQRSTRYVDVHCTFWCPYMSSCYLHYPFLKSTLVFYIHVALKLVCHLTWSFLCNLSCKRECSIRHNHWLSLSDCKIIYGGWWWMVQATLNHMYSVNWRYWIIVTWCWAYTWAQHVGNKIPDQVVLKDFFFSNIYMCVCVRCLWEIHVL
jgi:hypothetical protein